MQESLEFLENKVTKVKLADKVYQDFLALQDPEVNVDHQGLWGQLDLEE